MKINNNKIKSLILLSLVGSGLGKENNQSQEINKKLTKRDDSNSPRILFAGYPITFENKKNCTAAFIGNKQGIDGFITSAQCCVNNNCLNGNVSDNSDNVYENNDDGSITRIGSAYNLRFGEDGLDYVFVTSILTDWDNILYTAGLTSDDGTISELYPVTSYLTPNETGLEVCAYGAKSGYRCGTLNEIDAEVTIPNPWNGNPTVLKLNQVYLGPKGFESEEDIGGPVYLQNNNSGIMTVQALGHITSLFADDRAGRQYFYYTPIEKVLSTGIIELTTRFPSQINNDVNVVETNYSERNDTMNISLEDEKKNEYIFGGDGLVIEGSKHDLTGCTAGFAIIKNGQWKGMLMAGHCAIDEEKDSVMLRRRVDNSNPIGHISDLVIGGKAGDEFAFVDVYSSEATPMPCVAVPKKGWFGPWIQYLPVTSSDANLDQGVGARVCTVGFKNGLVCGDVREVNGKWTMKWPDENFNPGKTRDNLLEDLIVVQTAGWFGGNFLTVGDSGAPVFDGYDEKSSTSVAGIRALGHVVMTFELGFPIYGKYFGYMPLSKTFKARDFELMTVNMSSNNICASIKEGKQQSQIEVPPKK